jgi:flagellar biosynthesis GTPase FlhF
MKEERKKEKEEMKEERKKEKEEMKEERKKEKEEMKEERKKEKEEREEERKKEKEEREEERKKEKESQKDFMKRMDRLDYLFAQTREQIGGISKSNGEFCEEYFINSFKENPTLLGEKYDYVAPYLIPHPMIVNDEYDLVLQNGTTTALIEMKYKADTHDVSKMFSKLYTYRTNYPIFENCKIYLCLASFRFPKAVRQKAEKEGIVLIQQRGEKIEVISEHIKTW